MSLIACKYCIMTKGLKGSDISKLPTTEEEFIEHIERDHNIPVQRDGETEVVTMERFYTQYPEAKNPETCKCPECSAQRDEKHDAKMEEEDK